LTSAWNERVCFSMGCARFGSGFDGKWACGGRPAPGAGNRVLSPERQLRASGRVFKRRNVPSAARVSSSTAGLRQVVVFDVVLLRAVAAEPNGKGARGPLRG